MKTGYSENGENRLQSRITVAAHRPDAIYDRMAARCVGREGREMAIAIGWADSRFGKEKLHANPYVYRLRGLRSLMDDKF